MFTDKRYFVKFNNIKQYLFLIKQKLKNSKIPTYLNETMFENQEQQKCMC